MPYRLPPYPQLIAHAGNSGFAPENTRPAIEQAIAIGIDMVEVDVSLSREGIPVLIHGPTLNRTTNGTGRVDKLSMDQLKQLDAGSWKGTQFAGEPLLSLWEGLELARNRVGILIDLKTDRAIPAALEAIRDMRMMDQVVIAGWRACVDKIQATNSHSAVLLSLDQPLKLLVRAGPAALFRNRYLAQARKTAPAGINIDHRFVEWQLVDAAHRQGLSVWTWTVDDEARLKELVDLGVDSISTNWPGRMLKVMNRPEELQPFSP